MSDQSPAERRGFHWKPARDSCALAVGEKAQFLPFRKLQDAAMKLLLPFFLLSASVLAATPDITIENGWIRALPGAVPSGGYFLLHNAGKKAATLTGAESPACGMLMLHVSENKGGMSAMRHVESVDIAPGGTLEFKQGSYHLMCMQATGAIEPGASVPVTLIFQDGAKVTANFAVREAMGK